MWSYSHIKDTLNFMQLCDCTFIWRTKLFKNHNYKSENLKFLKKSVRLDLFRCFPTGSAGIRRTINSFLFLLSASTFRHFSFNVKNQIISFSFTWRTSKHNATGCKAKRKFIFSRERRHNDRHQCVWSQNYSYCS